MSDNLSQAHSKYIVLFVVILMSNWQNGSVVIDVTRFRRANKSCTSIHDSSLCLRALLYSPVINSSFLLRRCFSVFCSFHTLCCYFFFHLHCFVSHQNKITFLLQPLLFLHVCLSINVPKAITHLCEKQGLTLSYFFKLSLSWSEVMSVAPLLI